MLFFPLSLAFVSCLPNKSLLSSLVLLFDVLKLMFTALEHMFVGVELMFEAVEHKILRSKITFFFRFHQINQPNSDKKQLSFLLNQFMYQGDGSFDISNAPSLLIHYLFNLSTVSMRLFILSVCCQFRG